MDEEQQLLFQEGLLVQELELVRAKIKYVRLMKAEHKKESVTPSPAMDKGTVKVSTPQQKVNLSPCPEMCKDKSIPEQTAPGKESTNPLIADALLKSINEVQTSETTLVKPSDFNLRPNGGIQIPKKAGSSPVVEQSTEEEIQISKTNSKAYYVVFNGNNSGIYDSWDLAKKASDGVSNVKHKKFKSFLEAKTSANLYTRELMKPELKLVSKNEFLKPNSFAQAVKNGRDKIVVLGKAHNKEVIPDDDGLPPIARISDFEYLFNCAKIADEKMFVEERYFTTDKKNISFFNFCKNANSELIREAFDHGLIDTIYPSHNLLEISQFPKDLKKSIKNFRTKCLPNSDKDIFIKIKSSIPVWKDETQIYSPFYIIQVGVSNGVKYSPSRKAENRVQREDYYDLAVKQHIKLIDLIFKINDESKIFINYCGKHALMYSSSFQPINQEGKKQILIFRKRIASGNIFGPHNKDICEAISKNVKIAGLPPTKCDKCKNEEKSSKAMSTEEDKASSSTSTN